MAGVKMGQMTNRVRWAPPSPPIPLHSTDWGPEGRLLYSSCFACVEVLVSVETIASSCALQLVHCAYLIFEE
eukprot:scaffold8128_cov153-Skeletonema_marinoi.AAC.2